MDEQLDVELQKYESPPSMPLLAPEPPVPPLPTTNVMRESSESEILVTLEYAPPPPPAPYVLTVAPAPPPPAPMASTIIELYAGTVRVYVPGVEYVSAVPLHESAGGGSVH